MRRIRDRGEEEDRLRILPREARPLRLIREGLCRDVREIFVEKSAAKVKVTEWSLGGDAFGTRRRPRIEGVGKLHVVRSKAMISAAVTRRGGSVSRPGRN